MKKVELLAPAGNLECLKAAVNNGADAVYLGGQQFSNRAFADNFNDEQLLEAIAYAHIKNVKIYVGINVMIYEQEIDKVIEYIDFLYLNDVDALIVSDLGIISLVSRRYPDFPIHVSTQANVLNLWQVKFYEKYNVKRIILARETPLSVIKLIKENTNIDIEVFAFGALCVCYSGNCLHSSFIGKRSGNRGMCAQPCRMKYSLISNGKIINDKTYLLSLKDLNILDNIDKVIDSGVNSLKIEGRMKSKEYVALICSTFRKAIDYYYENKKVNDCKEDIEKVSKIFSRGFTKGYMLYESNDNISDNNYPSHLGTYLGKVLSQHNNLVKIKLATKLNQNDRITILNENIDEIKVYVNKIYVNGKLVPAAFKDEIAELKIYSRTIPSSTVYKSIDSKFVEKVDEQIDNNIKKIKIRMKLTIKVGEKISLEVSDLKNKVKVQSDEVVEMAISSPTSQDKMIDCLSRIKSTAYEIELIDIDSDNKGIVKTSVINDLRREAIEKLNDIRKNYYSRKKENIVEDIDEYLNIKRKNTISVNVTLINKKQLDVVSKIKGISNIYYDNIDDYQYVKEKYPKLPIIPVARRVDDNKYIESNRIVTSNFGDLIKYNESSIYIGNYANLANHLSIEEMLKENAMVIALSPELSKGEIGDIVEYFDNKYGTTPNFEILAYGKIQTMITKYCPISKSFGMKNKHCNKCRNASYYLKDRLGYEFYIKTDGMCNVTLYNSVPINLFDNIDEILDLGINNINLAFVDESADEIEKIINAFIDRVGGMDIKLNLSNTTYGYFQD